MVLIPQRPYKSWTVSESDYPQTGTSTEQGQFLVRYALLAANAHNTQPWKFLVNEHTIELIPDFSRSLPKSDPLYREFFVSLGWALGNLLVAAEHFGFTPLVSYGSTVGQTEQPIVTIELQPQTQPAPSAELFPWIVERRMNRYPYKQQTISEEILKDIGQYNDEEHVVVTFVTQAAYWQEVLDLVEQATLGLMDDGSFMNEWLPWMRSVYTRKFDGLTLFDFGVPGPLTLFPKRIFDTPARAQAEGIKKLFGTSPVFLMVGSTVSDQEHWLRAGKTLAYVSLAATKHGVAMAPWGAVVEHEETAQKLAQLLHIPRPAFFGRMGYAEAIPHHSPRRPVEHVLIR